MILEKGTFGIFPAYIAKGLHPIQQTILCWLWFHKNKEGTCFPSLQTLANECNSAKSTIACHLAILEEKNLIKRTKRQDYNMSQLSTFYEIIISNDEDKPKITPPPVRQTDSPCPFNEHPLSAKRTLTYINVNQIHNNVTGNDLKKISNEKKKYNIEDYDLLRIQELCQKMREPDHMSLYVQIVQQIGLNKLEQAIGLTLEDPKVKKKGQINKYTFIQLDI